MPWGRRYTKKVRSLTPNFRKKCFRAFGAKSLTSVSEAGWTSRKKVPLGIRLKSTRPSHGWFYSLYIPPEAKQIFDWRGFRRSGGGGLREFPYLPKAGMEILLPQSRAGCAKPDAKPRFCFLRKKRFFAFKKRFWG